MAIEDPKITIVTPTLNQARFIAETLRSVLDQNLGPSLHYIIQDAGSTDGTESIVRTFEPRFRAQGVVWEYIREPDAGQADAINRGWRRARGDILGFLNSDDRYCPGALGAVLDYFASHPDVQWAYGGWRLIGASGFVYATVRPKTYRRERLLNHSYIGQPACFIRRALLREVGELRTDLHYAMDYDLWLRAAQRCAPGIIPAILADMRYHATAKSSAHAKRQLMEILRLGMAYTAPWSWRRFCQYFYFLRGWAVVGVGWDITRRIERAEQQGFRRA